MGRRFNQRSLKRKDRIPSLPFGYMPPKNDGPAPIRYNHVVERTKRRVICPFCPLEFIVDGEDDFRNRLSISDHIEYCRQKQNRRVLKIKLYLRRRAARPHNQKP